MARIGSANKVMACIGSTYIFKAYIDVAYIGSAYIFMAYTVMAFYSCGCATCSQNIRELWPI